MGLLTRISRIFKSEANAAVDKIEDPTKMSEQILRELRENLQQAINGEAEIKAIALGHRSDEAKARGLAAEWEKKTNDLLDRVDSKSLDEVKGNELASAAALNVQTYNKQAEDFKKMADKEESALSVMDSKIKKIREQITETEQRTQMIKAQAKTAEVSEKINKTLSSVDTDGLMNTLKRMEEKTSAQEFRAQAYAEVSDSTMSTSQEIDKVLGQTANTDALTTIKAKRAAKTTETNSTTTNA